VNTTRWIDPAQLEALGQTRIRARAVLEGVITGLHRNPHRGSSVEFAEYREYRPGDDLRHVDWRVWGRMDRYQVKLFEDETNTRFYLLLDASGSMDYAAQGLATKFTWAATLVATLAWLALRQGDAAGLLLFQQEPGIWLPPSSRRGQLDDLCTLLDQARPRGRTSIAGALSRLTDRVKGRSVVVLVSDLLDDAEDRLTMARVLRRRGMEVVLFHVMDPDEVSLPFEGIHRFEGLEDDGWLEADPDDLREAYQAAFQAHADGIRDQCRAGDLEYFAARTDAPVEAPLLAFARSRLRGGAR
jgi:uncharacterized protein (DUF58 family)